MRGLFDKIWRAFDWVDAIEIAVPAILAALVVAVGPLLLGVYLIRTQHLLAGCVSFGLWLLAASAGVRDFRRRHFGWASVTLGVAWLTTIVILWWRLETP